MPFGNRAALDAGRGGKYEVSQDCVLVLEGSRMGLEAVVVQEGGGGPVGGGAWPYDEALRGHCRLLP